MSKKLTLVEVIPRFRKKHGDKYNYDFFEYAGMHDKSLILCDCGNIFAQTPMSHLSGSGCSTCASINQSLLQKMTTDEAIIKFIEVHHCNYNYVFFEHTGSREKGLIICNECNELFTQSTGSHLDGSGCPECAGNRNKTNLKFIEEAKILRGEVIDYTFTLYKKSTEKTLFLCKVCGELFAQLPFNHLNKRYAGSGCPRCSPKGFNANKPAILYYLLDIITGWYKIGITNRTVQERFGSKMKEIKVIQTWSFENGRDAHDQEQAYHKQFKEQRIINENFANVGGKTEFFVGDVLNLDKEK